MKSASMFLAGANAWAALLDAARGDVFGALLGVAVVGLCLWGASPPPTPRDAP